MRKTVQSIYNKIQSLGGDIDEKDIDLRDILEAMLKLIDEALPQEVEPN